MAAPTAVYTAIDTTRTDPKSPIDEDLKVDEANNDEFLNQMVTGGASAPEDLVTDNLQVKGTSTPSVFDGDLTVTGQLVTGSFFVSDFVQNFDTWGYTK